jgi:hypothetical protein
MEFKHDQTWDTFEQVFNSHPTTKDGWNKLIDFHQKTKEKPFWTALRNLDFETEQLEIKNWLEELVQTEPIDKKIIAFWVGITKFVDDQDKESYTIYLVGCDNYDESDIEWATEPTYMPEERYFTFDTLNKIDEIIKADSDDYSFLDWILPLSYCALTLDNIIRNNLDSKLFLKYHDKIFVSTGHDSGDYKNVSAIGQK